MKPPPMPVTPLTMWPNTGLSLTDVQLGHRLPSSRRRHLIDLGHVDHGQPGCLQRGYFQGWFNVGRFEDNRGTWRGGHLRTGGGVYVKHVIQSANRSTLPPAVRGEPAVVRICLSGCGQKIGKSWDLKATFGWTVLVWPPAGSWSGGDLLP